MSASEIVVYAKTTVREIAEYAKATVSEIALYTGTVGPLQLTYSEYKIVVALQ